jgi:glycosyltransferase involved in cell wall biosynthesis
MLGKFARLAPRYDVFHFHFALSFLPEAFGNVDARLLRRLGKCVVVEFWGNDVHLASVDAQRNPYFRNACDVDEELSRKRLERWAEITDGHVIVSDNYFDPFLQPYFSHIHVVRQRVDTRQLAPSYPRADVAEPHLVHAPTDTSVKGTRYIRDAVQSLRARGFRFEYTEVIGMPQSQALSIYRQADLIIDQLRIGTPGVLAAEAMSLGKPVVCYTLPELVPTFPEGFPIINANPDTIETVLEEWLQRPEDRHRLGLQSREYAERVHDCRIVASRLVQAYQSARQ